MSILVEYTTDFQPPEVAREVAGVILDVLENPHKERPAGEIFIGQMAKEFVIHFPIPCVCTAHLPFPNASAFGDFR